MMTQRTLLHYRHNMKCQGWYPATVIIGHITTSLSNLSHATCTLDGMHISYNGVCISQHQKKSCRTLLSMRDSEVYGRSDILHASTELLPSIT